MVTFSVGWLKIMANEKQVVSPNIYLEFMASRPTPA